MTPKKRGAKKIPGERFNFILRGDLGDYAYGFMREHGLRSMAEALNRIIDEHRKANSNTRITPLNTSTKSSVQ